VTVAELIEELGKFPAHHVVVCAYTDTTCSEIGFGSESEESVFDVQAGGKGLVVLDCTERD
jgi:hypothetical protein